MTDSRGRLTPEALRIALDVERRLRPGMMIEDGGLRPMTNVEMWLYCKLVRAGKDAIRRAIAEAWGVINRR